MYPKKISGVPVTTHGITTAFVRKCLGLVPVAWTFPSHQASYYEFSGVEEPQGSDDPLLGKALDNSGNSEKCIESRPMLSSVLYILFWKKTREIHGCFEPKAVCPQCLYSKCCSKFMPLEVIFRTSNYCLCLHHIST